MGEILYKAGCDRIGHTYVRSIENAREDAESLKSIVKDAAALASQGKKSLSLAHVNNCSDGDLKAAAHAVELEGVAKLFQSFRCGKEEGNDEDG